MIFCEYNPLEKHLGGEEEGEGETEKQLDKQSDSESEFN